MAENRQPAALLPFRGLRFRDDLAAVIGPPADIESSDEARAFVRDRPRNAVRLEIADDSADLRFTAARALLSDWERRGVLVPEARPSFYVYEQEFDDIHVRRVRRGVFGLAPIDVPEVCVLPHEDTWEDNLARRTRLLRDLRASLSPIFLLFNGDDALPRLLDDLTRRAPDATGVDAFGETHRLWAVSDPPDVRGIEAAMQGRHYVIADGHHRYAAARAFRDERPDIDAGVILACCVEANDPGIVIRPIHRVLTTTPAVGWADALDRLGAWFDIASSPVGAASGWDLVVHLGAGTKPTIGLLLQGGAELLTLRLREWEAVAALLPADVVEPVRALDVTVASTLVIERAFRLEPDAHGDSIAYTNDPDAALADVRAGAAQAALLLRPPRLGQVMAVARAGGRMPPKSTSFVPKLPIGLVMRDFEPASGPE